MKECTKRMVTGISLLIVCAGMMIFTGCLHTEKKLPEGKVDFSDESSWLALPEDPEEHPVDVFYVYPTIYQGKGVQDITDPEQIEASREPLYTQASVFEDTANIYAPMYRQVGRTGFEDTETLPENLMKGEEDVTEALLYYIEHLNEGRPFFIAGHSQGSSTLAAVLRKIWGSTGAEERMLAAYIIGFSITEDDLQANANIRMSEGPADTGCFIAYNSILDGVQDQSVQILEGSVATNPLSWVSSAEEGEYIPKDENLGAVFFSGPSYERSVYPGFTSAKVKDGGLVCEPQDMSVLSDYPIEGIFHRDDFSLFFMNLKENIAARADAYLGR